MCHLSRVTSATYHQNCRFNGSNYELSSCQMLKHTHTTRNIFRSKHHTNRSDLTPQFHLLDSTMVYKNRDKRKQLHFVCHLSRVSSATYHQNCRYNGSNYELSSCQMLKHTHTTRNICRSKHHTNRSDLTPQFHLLDPTMVYKHRDCYVK